MMEDHREKSIEGGQGNPVVGSNKTKYVYTLLASTCFLVSGLMNITSASLLDIAELTQSRPPDVAYGISLRFAAYCLGAPFFGWLYHQVNRQLVLTFLVSGAAVATTTIPMTHTLHSYWLAQVINGFQSVGIDVACFAWVIEMWPDNANPYLQGLYLGLALGTALSSAIAEPFLSYVDKVPISMGNGTTMAHVFHPSRIMIPYTFVSAVAFFTSSLLLVMYFKYPYVKNCNIVEAEDANNNLQENNVSMSEGTSSLRVGATLIVSSLMLGCHIASEVNTQSFLPTFAVFSPLHLSKSQGALMLSLLSGSTVVSVCAAIPIATKVSADLMLLASLSILLTGLLVLWMSLTTSVYLMWLSVILMGIGYASIFPCMYTLISQKIVTANWMFGIFSLIKSAARIIPPLITGPLIEQHPFVFVYFNLVSLGLTLVMNAILRSR